MTEQGPNPAAVRALAALEAAGASGLASVDTHHSPALPPRTAPRVDFLDRAHVERVTTAEYARCCPWRLMFAPLAHRADATNYPFYGSGGKSTVFADVRVKPGEEAEGLLPAVARAPSSFFFANGAANARAFSRPCVLATSDYGLLWTPPRGQLCFVPEWGTKSGGHSQPRHVPP